MDSATELRGRLRSEQAELVVLGQRLGGSDDIHDGHRAGSNRRRGQLGQVLLLGDPGPGVLAGRRAAREGPQ